MIELKENIRLKLHSYIDNCSTLEPEIFELGINFGNLSGAELGKLLVLLNRIELNNERNISQN